MQYPKSTFFLSKIKFRLDNRNRFVCAIFWINFALTVNGWPQFRMILFNLNVWTLKNVINWVKLFIWNQIVQIFDIPNVQFPSPFFHFTSVAHSSTLQRPRCSKVLCQNFRWFLFRQLKLPLSYGGSWPNKKLLVEHSYHFISQKVILSLYLCVSNSKTLSWNYRGI